MIDIKKLNLKTNRLVDSLFVGNYKTAFKWKWIEFFDYRVYNESDDAKNIDFLASSKEQKLLIKRFEEERELSVFFLLDISKTMEFWYEKQKKIDTLIESFYILWLSATKNNDKVWGFIFNENGFEFIKPKKWIKNIIKIIKVINDNKIKKINNFSYNYMLNYFNNLPIRNSLVFILTDKMDEFEDKKLKITSIKNDFVYINIFDYFENNLDNNWLIRLKDRFKIFFLNLNNKKNIEKYKALRKQKIEVLQKKLMTFKISYLYIDNKTNIFLRLLIFFKTR